MPRVRSSYCHASVTIKCSTVSQASLIVSHYLIEFTSALELTPNCNDDVKLTLPINILHRTFLGLDRWFWNEETLFFILLLIWCLILLRFFQKTWPEINKTQAVFFLFFSFRILLITYYLFLISFFLSCFFLKRLFWMRIIVV